MGITSLIVSYISYVLSTIYSFFLPAEPVESILPFIPKPIKYLLLFLCLINCRSWPFTWHVRVWRPLLWMGIRKGLPICLSPKAQGDAIWDSVCPIGVNPLDRVSEWKSWASPDECDYNFHLSNSSYAKNWDSARFKGLMEDCNRLFADGGRIAIAGTYYHFVKEIPILSKYSVRSSVICWDEKWIYTMTRFVTPPKKSSKKTLTSRVQQQKQQSQQVVQGLVPLKEKEFTRSLQSRGLSSSAASPTSLTIGFLFKFASKHSSHAHSERESTDSSPITTPGNATPDLTDSDTDSGNEGENIDAMKSQSAQDTLPSASTLPSSNPESKSKSPLSSFPLTEPDGSTVHCVALSRCCWKFGRITIPASLALACNGFGLTPSQWEHVRGIRDRGEMPAFLKGGWKEVTGERWWEVAMGVPEIEERRVRNLEKIAGVKDSLDWLTVGGM